MCVCVYMYLCIVVHDNIDTNIHFQRDTQLPVISKEKQGVLSAPTLTVQHTLDPHTHHESVYTTDTRASVVNTHEVDTSSLDNTHTDRRGSTHTHMHAASPQADESSVQYICARVRACLCVCI
jgi:hypothetical protein